MKFPALVNSAQESGNMDDNRRFDGIKTGKGDRS